MAIWGEVDLPAEAWSWHKMETIKTMGFSLQVPQQTECGFTMGGLVPCSSSQVNMVLKVIGDINMRSLIWRLDGWWNENPELQFSWGWN
jgi:hypothetical protein